MHVRVCLSTGLAGRSGGYRVHARPDLPGVVVTPYTQRVK